MTKQNAIRCDTCRVVIESKHRHDFKYCECKRVFVDGGSDYQRVGLSVEEGSGFTRMRRDASGMWVEVEPPGTGYEDEYTATAA